MKTVKMVLLLSLLLSLFCSSPQSKQKRVLIYTKNGEGYVHKNIESSVNALKKICDLNNIAYDVSDDPSLYAGKNLEQYDALIFTNTNNEAFDTDEQRAVFKQYIRSGGGFVGIHSACGSERKWDWFAAMIGGRFVRHPKSQDFDLKVYNRDFPATAHLDSVWHWKNDECYYLDHLNPEMNILLAADLTTVEDPKREEYPGTIFGDLFPISWYHTFEGGRVFYTALGHRNDHYEDAPFIKHLQGGILWAIGLK